MPVLSQGSERGPEQAHQTLRVINAAGLHARPCHAIVTLAQEYGCELRVRCKQRDVNGKSILELMTLGAAVGNEIEISARGSGAAELVDRLVRLVASGFGESS